MTTAHATATHRHVRVGRAPRPLGAVALLTARLVARGTLAIALGLGTLMMVEGVTFETAYPDAASRQALLFWAEDPGVRIISGTGSAVDTVGGFVVWDAGLYLTLISAAWALTASTRILRGDEEAGRSDAVQVGAMRAQSMLAVQLGVVLAACLVIGGTVGLALALVGAQAEGSWLSGLVVAGYAAVLVATGALASQVFGTRRRALSVAGAVLLAWILLRLTANSTDERAWLGWFTPAGWFDRSGAFDANRWEVPLVAGVATLVIGGAAVLLRGLRDAGAGLVRSRTTVRTRAWGLGGTAGFAWRSNLGVLLAWAVGLTAAGLIVGTMLPVVDDFLEEDEGFVELLAVFGLDIEDVMLGFVAMISTILGLVIAVYAAFRMGATRAEEASERADQLLTRPLARWRWLGAHAATLAASVVVLAAVSATAVWVGAAATGARVTAADAFSAMANALPAISVFAGFAVLVFGLLPRLTVALAATVAAVAYLIEVVGPLLEWPEWVLGISPFHHLEQVPVDPMDVPAALVLVGVGIVLALGGILAFERRDLVGA